MWIGRGYWNVSNGWPRIPDEGLDAENIEEAKMSMLKKIEEVKMSKFKIVFLPRMATSSSISWSNFSVSFSSSVSFHRRMVILAVL